MLGGGKTKIAVAAAAALAVAATTAVSQETIAAPVDVQTAATEAAIAGAAPTAPEATAGGRELVLTFSTTASINDNIGLVANSSGNTFTVDNDIGIRFSTTTAIQSLSLEAAAALRFIDRPSGGMTSDFEDPEYRLNYTREGSRSRLTFDARYVKANLLFSDPLDGGVDDGLDLVAIDGTRISRDLGLLVETGIDTPLGLNFEARSARRDYSETIDPDLFDISRDTLTATAIMRLSPVMTGTLEASREDYSAADLEQTNRQTTTLSFGLGYELSASTKLDASLDWSRISTQDILGDRETSGLGGSIGLTRELRTGSASVLLKNERESSGSRNTLTFSRLLEMPGATLSATAGLTRSPRGESDFIAAMAYSRELKRGVIEASFSRGVAMDEDAVDTDLRNTRVSLGYTTAVNSLSSLDFSYDYARTEGTSTSEDVTRSSFRAAYNRELTEDWDMSTGYLWEKRNEAGVGGGSSNSIFLTLGRDFNFRPEMVEGAAMRPQNAINHGLVACESAREVIAPRANPILHRPRPDR